MGREWLLIKEGRSAIPRPSQAMAVAHLPILHPAPFAHRHTESWVGAWSCVRAASVGVTNTTALPSRPANERTNMETDHNPMKKGAWPSHSPLNPQCLAQVGVENYLSAWETETERMRQKDSQRDKKRRGEIEKKKDRVGDGGGQKDGE